LKLWLEDPPERKPGSLMPDLGLTDEQIDDLTAYLLSLE
jgi:cytochrome c1